MFIHEMRQPSIKHTAYAGDSSDRQLIVSSEGLDYVAECGLTASGVFRCDHIGQLELVRALRRFQAAGEDLNCFKKAMFRKQSRDEAKLPTSFALPSVDTLLAGQEAQHADFFHGIIGISTESAELAELLADVLEGKRRFDITNTREEIGDCLWYLSRLVRWAETTFLSEMRRNIAKLRTRHGLQGFSKEGDMNRSLDAEHAILKGDF